MAAAQSLRSFYLAKVLITIVALALMFGLFRVILRQGIADQLESLARAIPGCTGIRYARLTIPYFTLQCRLQDAALLFDGRDDTIALQSVHIRRFRPGGRLPRVLDAALTGVQLRARQPLVAPLEKSLRELGYPALTGDLELRWDRRGEKQEEWTVDLRIRVADAGEMVLSVRLDKVNAQGVALALENPFNWLLVLPAIELVAAQCDYRDKGLFERALLDAARKQGQRPEAVRKALLNHLRLRTQTEKDPHIQAVWRSTEAFCRHPERIILHTRLPRPVPLGQLLWIRQPRDLIRGLALESRTE